MSSFLHREFGSGFYHSSRPKLGQRVTDTIGAEEAPKIKSRVADHPVLQSLLVETGQSTLPMQLRAATHMKGTCL